MLDYIVIPIKLEGFFEKYPKLRLSATRPLFVMERGRASKHEQVLINLILPLSEASRINFMSPSQNYPS